MNTIPFTPMQSTNMANLTDEKLYSLCCEYGERALFWRRKFIGLLPEVYRRRLFERRGFSSIFEFAKKLAGLSEEQVRLTLNLERRFADVPKMQALLVNGEVSINKLARVASVITTDNEELFVNQVRLLSNRALEVFVRDEKILNGFYEPKNEDKSLHVQKCEMLQLSDEVKERLKNLQKKGININTLLTQLLDQRDAEIASEKEKLAQQCEPRHGRGTVTKVPPESAHAVPRRQPRPASRYIPIRIRNLITKEYGTACSIASCTKPARIIHHTQRFAITHSHNPRFLAPVCAEHHQIAHSIDLKYQEKRVKLTL